MASEKEVIEIGDTDGGGDYSDSDCEEERALKAKLAKLETRRARKKRKTVSDGVAFWALTEAQRNQLRESQTSPHNKGLQRILFEIGCDFTLFEHQYVGVRVIAGVSENFPAEGKERLEALRSALPRRENDSGIIMADVMGLGKVSLLW
jgi:hypothetical protein